MNAVKPSRLHGFDLIRLFSFFVVAYYHFTYALWRGHDEMYYAITDPDQIFNWTLHPFERAMAFSGHTLLFLSMMLIALARKSFKTTMRFSIFLVLAWLLFTWADNDFGGMVAAWDIHPLIFVGLITIVGAETIDKRLVPIFGIVGFLITLIHFADMPFFTSMNIYARSILVGDCLYGVSSWPVLPWLGFLYAGYALGFMLRQPRVREYASRLPRAEFAVWIVLLLVACINVGAYFRIRMVDWECEAFRLPPYLFYSDFIFVLFAIRLSLLAKVDEFLGRKFSWLTRLNVSRNFFLAYALQYAFGFAIAASFGDTIRLHSQAYMWIGISMLPLAELVAWVAAKLGARRLFKGGA